MLYLRRTKEELKSDIVIKNKNILIPIIDYDLVCLCPTCNKVIDVDLEIIKAFLNEEKGFEDIAVYCDYCGKRVFKTREEN